MGYDWVCIKRSLPLLPKTLLQVQNVQGLCGRHSRLCGERTRSTLPRATVGPNGFDFAGKSSLNFSNVSYQ